ncbi:MAG: ferredoxin family protein [Anaerolineales bacterium]
MKVFDRSPMDLAQISVPLGQVYLVPERCKGCEICVEFCPREVLVVSELRNAKGYHLPEVAPGKEEACVHCEFCTMICPEFAIFTLVRESEALP